MSNNYIYNGVTTPQWNQIDYIHFGSAYSLNAENDNILLGRYVLVKYTPTVFTQDQKYQLMNGIGEANNFADAALWKECYNQDSGKNNPDYDGVVFQKVFKDNAMQYIPIAQLSTNISPQVFASDYLTIEDAEDTYVSLADNDIGKMRAFFSSDEDKENALDRLAEIQAFLGDTENEGAETLISQVSTNATNIGEIQNQIIGLKRQIVIPIEEVEGFANVTADTSWNDLNVNSEKLLPGQLYSKPSKETRTLIHTENIWWNPFNTNGITDKFQFSIDELKLWGDTLLYRGGYCSSSYTDESGSYRIATYGDYTYPIIYYRLTKDFEEVDELNSKHTVRWFGLLYLKTDSDYQNFSLHFTCSKHDIENEWIEDLDQYDSEIGEHGAILKQYSDFSTLKSIEDIVKDCLGENNQNIEITLIDYIEENYNYTKHKFLTNILQSQTIDIETREIKYITVDNGNEGKRNWSTIMGITTDLPQWQTF